MFFHRRTEGIPTENTEFWKKEKQRLISAANSGDVLVTPGISECEKRIKNMALEQRLRLIHVQADPIGRYWKPERTDDIFAAETEILKNLGSGESCVIAGRLGFHVFREHPNHMSIFIQASMPFRIKRLMSKQNMTEEEARTVIEKIDEMRETYVKKYAKTSRYDTRNYDLVITADGKKEEEIAEYILQFLE